MPNRRPSLMGLSMTPWEHHPALTRDRLITIAQLIQRGRNMALDRFDPNVGCTGWTLGCEAFAFQRHQIIEAAADIDWLEILDATMQFVFSSSEERRVGKECVSTCRSRWAPDH